MKLHVSKYLAKAILVTSSLVAAFAPAASAADLKMRAEIPFKFRVGDDVLPAGTYWIQVNKATGRVELTASNVHKSQLLAGPEYRDVQHAESGRLEFTVNGTEHFLRKVWMNGSMMGNRVPISTSKVEMAKAGKLHTIVIAAK